MSASNSAPSSELAGADGGPQQRLRLPGGRPALRSRQRTTRACAPSRHPCLRDAGRCRSRAPDRARAWRAAARTRLTTWCTAIRRRVGPSLSATRTWRRRRRRRPTRAAPAADRDHGDRRRPPRAAGRDLQCGVDGGAGQFGQARAQLRACRPGREGRPSPAAAARAAGRPDARRPPPRAESCRGGRRAHLRQHVRARTRKQPLRVAEQRRLLGGPQQQVHGVARGGEDAGQVLGHRVAVTQRAQVPRCAPELLRHLAEGQ